MPPTFLFISMNDSSIIQGMILWLPTHLIKSLQTATLIKQSYKWIKTEERERAGEQKKNLYSVFSFSLSLPSSFFLYVKINWNTIQICLLVKSSWFDSYMSISMCIHPGRFFAWHYLEIQFISSFVCSLRWWRLPLKRILFFFVIHFNKTNVCRYFFFLPRLISILMKKNKKFLFFLIKQNHASHLLMRISISEIWSEKGVDSFYQRLY
jgi:hypothetical protein